MSFELSFGYKCAHERLLGYSFTKRLKDTILALICLPFAKFACNLFFYISFCCTAAILKRKCSNLRSSC